MLFAPNVGVDRRAPARRRETYAPALGWRRRAGACQRRTTCYISLLLPPQPPDEVVEVEAYPKKIRFELNEAIRLIYRVLRRPLGHRRSVPLTLKDGKQDVSEFAAKARMRFDVPACSAAFAKSGRKSDSCMDPP